MWKGIWPLCPVSWARSNDTVLRYQGISKSLPSPRKNDWSKKNRSHLDRFHFHEEGYALSCVSHSFHNDRSHCIFVRQILQVSLRPLESERTCPVAMSSTSQSKNGKISNRGVEQKRESGETALRIVLFSKSSKLGSEHWSIVRAVI